VYGTVTGGENFADKEKDISFQPLLAAVCLLLQMAVVESGGGVKDVVSSC
jgi:hypothetical protein